jgi:anti-sigma-K factor RskA
MNLNHDEVRDLAAGYVLGALSPEEEAAVRDHLSTGPEPHPEIAELGGVVPYLAESVEPVEPPASLRGRILAAAAAEPRGAERAATAASAPAQAAPPGTGSSPEPAPLAFPTAAERTARDVARAADRSRSVGTWALRIAAVFAIAALGAWNLQLQGRLSGVEDDLAAATAYQQGVASVLAVATQQGGAVAILTPTPDSNTTATGIAATGPDGTVVISMHELDPTSGSEVYEAWVIVGDSAPVPLGGFTVARTGTGVFRGTTALAEPGAILALTLEPGPGARTPTAPVLTVGALTSNS